MHMPGRRGSGRCSLTLKAATIPEKPCRVPRPGGLSGLLKGNTRWPRVVRIQKEDRSLQAQTLGKACLYKRREMTRPHLSNHGA
jgi:hypothetical protein